MALNRRRWQRVTAVLIIGALGFFGALVALSQGWLSDTDVDGGTPPPAAPQLTAEEEAYYAYVAPRLRELAAQARALARLGEEKSRDIFEIRARGDRLAALIDEVAAYGRDHGIPPRFAGPAAGFAEGARLVRQAMNESQAGLTRFDWDRVAAAVPVFFEGADRLDAAAAELEVLGGATPEAP